MASKYQPIVMPENIHPKERGHQSEAAVLHELVKRGVTVLEPFGDNERYDFVINIEGKFYRLQIKTARIENGRLQFETRSTGTLTRSIEKETYAGDVDAFIVYSPDIERTFAVEIADAPATSMSLRLKEPKKSSPNINWAENHSLDEWLEGL